MLKHISYDNYWQWIPIVIFVLSKPPGGTQVLHDQYPGTDVLTHLDGDVHTLLEDLARGDLPREENASQHLLSNGS